MSTSILIKNEEGNVIADVDLTNGALVIQDEIHSNIHRGIMFTASKQAAIADSAVSEFLIRVGSDKSAHMRTTMTVSHDMLLELFEAPTTTADGTAVAAHNRNRFSSTVAETLVFSGPTVTADGTNHFDGYIPGGDKHTASGGTGSSFEEWILKTNTDYLVRISNTLIAPAAAGHGGAVFDFYEPTQ